MARDYNDLLRFIETELGVELFESQKVMLQKLCETDKLYILFPPHQGRSNFERFSASIKELYGGNNDES